ncbi:hypothetical protein ACMFMG_009306 [Clarireedia jacksonii]
MSTFSEGDPNSAKPFFNYIKYLGNYQVDGGSSTGDGYFEWALRSVQPAFTVEEHNSTVEDFYSTPSVEVRIESEGLQELFRRALQRQDLSYTFNLATLLPYYRVLKSFLALEEQRHAENEQCGEAPDLNILELRLFVRNFLLDRTIFRGFGLKDRQDFPSPTHWQDMQQWSTQRDLDGLDSLFVEEGTSHLRTPHYFRLTSYPTFTYQRVETLLQDELLFRKFEQLRLRSLKQLEFEIQKIQQQESYFYDQFSCLEREHRQKNRA